MRTIIVLFCAIFGPVWMHAQVTISPTPEYRRGALSALSESERALVAEGVSFRIESRNSVFELPRSSKRSTATLFKISWAEFFSASNVEAANRENIPEVAIVRTKTVTRTFVDNGYGSPEFRLEIEWRSPSGQTGTAMGKAVGPTYKGRGDVRTQPESVRSSNYAFYAAYLKAMAQIAAEVQSEAPSSDVTPDEPSAKKKEGDASDLFGR